jgi:shikimate dehydrogenase
VRLEGNDITSYTGLLGLFGHPVRHSLSPRIHNAALRAQGLDFVYLAFDVEPQHLSLAVGALRALRMRGVNLTVPHKQAVLPLLDEVDPLAARVGAVNTIVNDGGRLIGHNTDVSGFAAALRTVRHSGAADLHCLVLGAGGAARAVVAALLEGGAAVVRVHNRTPERASELCTAARIWGGAECGVIADGDLRAAAASAHLIVNATSIGLGGRVKDFPLPVDTVHSGHVVVDLVYGVEPTALVQAARDRGATAIDGREMLLMQAARAYELWTGCEAPVNAMRDSIECGER